MESLTSDINVAKPKFDFPNVVSKIEAVSSAKESLQTFLQI